eukprot:TRINITY_DN2303_c0_g1_i3.p1 TRINITY_DN2303_c0_g1~~TRINITY_DN2303_c0_g1_i3.p1  ORF type:complete len:120 (+),score=10.66 TRINITY_DN2303_c0_g1_i3:123-482(+)
MVRREVLSRTDRPDDGPVVGSEVIDIPTEVCVLPAGRTGTPTNVIFVFFIFFPSPRDYFYFREISSMIFWMEFICCRVTAICSLFISNRTILVWDSFVAEEVVVGVIFVSSCRLVNFLI